MPSELAQELGAREGQQVPGPAGPEGQPSAARRGPSRRRRAARHRRWCEQLAVELFELLDGVGDREQPAQASEHRCRLRTHGRHRQPARQSGRRWATAPFAFESARMVPSTTLLLVAGGRERNYG